MSATGLRAPYTVGEELANSLTHGLGLALSFAGLIVLIVASAGDMLAFSSCVVFGVCLIVLYTTSTLYHSAKSSQAKQVLRTLDHVAIFLLIAGTYTPFVLITLHGAWGWTLFVIVWTLAGLGIIFELSALRRFRRAMVALYVGMGWVGLIAIKPLAAALPAPALWLMFGGGISYTAGVLFYRWHSLRYHHAVWHLFVLGGSVLHYFAVLWYVLPQA